MRMLRIILLRFLFHSARRANDNMNYYVKMFTNKSYYDTLLSMGSLVITNHKLHYEDIKNPYQGMTFLERSSNMQINDTVHL